MPAAVTNSERALEAWGDGAGADVRFLKIAKEVGRFVPTGTALERAQAARDWFDHQYWTDVEHMVRFFAADAAERRRQVDRSD